MPYPPAGLVLRAAHALIGKHPIAIVTLPALLSAALGAGRDPVVEGVPYGSTQETSLLSEYFTLPRPPDANRPYRVPWSEDAPWQTKKYPGGGLQRLRTDAAGRGRVLRQEKTAQGPDIWHITPAAGAEFVASYPNQAVRLVDLALWFGRDLDTADLDTQLGGSSDLDRIVVWFRTTFGLDVADLIGTAYTTDIPEAYRQMPFTDTPIGIDTFEVLGSQPPAPTAGVDLPDLVDALEQRLRSGGYELPAGLVRRVLTGWLRGDIVVLVGQPGTGKTMFASLLAAALEAELELDPAVVVAIRTDFDEAEFIGYERLDGAPELRPFAKDVLMTDSPLEAKIVVLEEFNLASIETYMASILVATQEKSRRVQLPGNTAGQLPIDTFILATCNSYRDEPETRTRVSSPTKRRSTVITMPNVLGDRYEADPDRAVLSLVTGIISTARTSVVERIDNSRPAQFDSIRNDALSAVTSANDLSTEVQRLLEEVTSAILRTSIGRSWFTMGLLKDVVLAVAHAPRDAKSEVIALGESVADKLVHQVRGTHADIEELREVCGKLPNAAEIDAMFDRMMDGPSDELLPLL
ncbi:AAA family ATPase [Williamsia sp. MIQD14]|uniref:AAA family ATPase n=1 Tax=Williamsia sp. MIQD14 TaxID=3425703 RepID=UPI003DA05BFF